MVEPTALPVAEIVESRLFDMDVYEEHYEEEFHFLC